MNDRKEQCLELFAMYALMGQALDNPEEELFINSYTERFLKNTEKPFFVATDLKLLNEFLVAYRDPRTDKNALKELLKVSLDSVIKELKDDFNHTDSSLENMKNEILQGESKEIENASELSEELVESVIAVDLLGDAQAMLRGVLDPSLEPKVTEKVASEFLKIINKQAANISPENLELLKNAQKLIVEGLKDRNQHVFLEGMLGQIGARLEEIQKDTGELKEKIAEKLDEVSSHTELSEEDQEILNATEESLLETKRLIDALKEKWAGSNIGKFFAAIGNWIKKIINKIRGIKEEKLFIGEGHKEVDVEAEEGLEFPEEEMVGGSLDAARIKANEAFPRDEAYGENPDWVVFKQAENDVFYFKEMLKKGEQPLIDMGARIQEISEIIDPSGKLPDGIVLNDRANLSRSWNELNENWKVLQAEEMQKGGLANHESPVGKFFDGNSAGTTLPAVLEEQIKLMDGIATQIDDGNSLENVDEMLKVFEGDRDKIMGIMAKGRAGVEEHWGKNNFDDGKEAIDDFKESLDSLSEVVKEYKHEAGKSLDL